MARIALEPGETGSVTMRGLDPETSRWRSVAALKAEGKKPAKWRATVRWHDPGQGRVRELSASASSRTRASADLSKTIERAKENVGLRPGSGRQSVSEMMTAYRQTIEESSAYAPRTKGQYLATIDRHLLAERCMIRNIQIAHLTAENISADMRRVIEDTGSTASLRHYRAVLNGALQNAVLSRAIRSNPMRQINELPRVRRKQRKVYKNGSSRTLNRALTEEEDARFLEAVENEPLKYIADLAIVLRYQGCRTSEGYSLRWEDLDFENRTIRHQGKLVRVKGKGLVWDDMGKSALSDRVVPMRTPALRVFTSRLHGAKGKNSSVWVFCTQTGAIPDPDNVNSHLRRLLDRAGLEHLTPGALRRTVEKELELAGASVAEREAFMGHTEAVARRHYADHAQLREEVLERLGRDSNPGPAA